MIPTVKHFFGVIDFTELPLALLEAPEQQRVKSLKQRVTEVVDQMLNQSEDFKTYIGNFEKILKQEGMQQSFENMFFEQILQDPMIKKVVGVKNLKRQKDEPQFMYGNKSK